MKIYKEFTLYQNTGVCAHCGKPADYLFMIFTYIDPRKDPSGISWCCSPCIKKNGMKKVQGEIARFFKSIYDGTGEHSVR